MAAKRLTLLALSAALTVGLAAWISGGILTLASGAKAAPRMAIVPSLLWLLLWLAVAVLLAFVWTRSRRTPLLTLSAVLLLPWLPVPVPAAFYIWTGALRTWLWILLIVALAAPRVRTWVPGVIATAARDPRRAPTLAALVAGILYLWGAYQVFPRLPAGDEPHYLVIAQSLLSDRDLQIENNHRQGDYHAYYGGDLRPDYLRRGSNGAIYSVHAPGLPIVVAPVFALLGYRGVLIFLECIGAWGTALAWRAAWRVTGDLGAAWFGWATVALSAPFFFQSFIVYPDAPGAVIVMLGVGALVDGRVTPPRRLLGLGGALAVLPWLHTRLVIPAVTLGALLLARQLGARDLTRRIAAFVSVPVVSAACWLGFFYAIYGTPDPRAPYGDVTQSAVTNLPSGLVGLLFDQQFGVLPSAPVYLCAAVGVLTLARRASRLTVELLLVLVPYAVAVAAYQMWWGGYSSPARFLVPILLPFAIPAAAWFKENRGDAARVFGLGALGVSVLITGTLALVDRGSLLYNMRDGASQLLTWLSPLVNLTTGLPGVFQAGSLSALATAGVWLAALAVTAMAGTIAARTRATWTIVALSEGFAAAAAAMIALTIVWHGHAATPLTPAAGSAALLRQYDSDSGQLGIRYAPFRRVPLSEIPARLTLADLVPASRRADDPLVFLLGLPAGTYAVEGEIAGGSSGHVTVVLDREFGSAWTWDLDGPPGLWRRDIRLPAPAPALVVDADPEARRSLARLSVRALDVVGSHDRLTDAEAQHVARYGPVLVFLVGGRAYMERAGVWVAGGGRARLVIAPDDRPFVRLLVRSPPVKNRVTLESGGWRQDLVLEPGGERLLDVPVPRGHSALLLDVTVDGGARPSEYERGSTDQRLLGCWLETR